MALASRDQKKGIFNPYERYKEQENSIHPCVCHPLSHVTTDPEEIVTNVPSWDFLLATSGRAKTEVITCRCVNSEATQRETKLVGGIS